MKTAIITILMFLIMVFIHEFGHFITAKASGVKVLEFAIGMGPAIFKKRGKETLYTIRLFPIGGYCSMEGEDAQSDDRRAFCNQKLWKRICVVLAGAVLNVILGFLIFVVLCSVSPAGQYSTTNIVEKVYPNAYLAQAGLRDGDKIIGINGSTVHFYPDIAMATENLKENDVLTVKVKRGAEKLEFVSKPSASVTVTTYQEDGILVESSLNGETESEFYPYNEQRPKNDELVGQSATSTRYILGITPASEAPTFTSVIKNSAYYTVFVVKLVYTSLFKIITGGGFQDMAGPVGIVSEVNTIVSASKHTLLDMLQMTALLTINLGVFNLLPIPALDGGRLLFLIIEGIRRKPIPAEKEGLIHAIGFILLMGIIVLVTFKDILKLIMH